MRYVSVTASADLDQSHIGSKEKWMLKLKQIPSQLFWLLIFTQSLLAAEPEKPVVDADGTVHIPAFAVPLPRYMSEEAKRQFIEEAHNPSLDQAVRNRTGGDPNAPIVKLREGVDDFYRPMVERAKALYPVNIEDRITSANLRGGREARANPHGSN
jgi:hypothetical protein